MTIRRFAVLCFGVLIAAGANAAELKIGFVNALKVSAEAPQSEAARNKLEQEFAPRDQQLVGMQKKVRELEERLQRDAAIMSEAERRDLERDVLEQKREIRRAQDEFREDFNIRRNEELAKLQRRVIETIQTLAKQEGFDLIVSDGVIYAADRIDITKRVIESLTREFNAKKQ